MKQGQADTITLPKAVTGAPLAIELRHLRYFVALADAGSFTHAAAPGGAPGGLGARLDGTPSRCRVLADPAAPGRRRPGLAGNQPRGAARPARCHEPRRVRTRCMGPRAAHRSAPRHD